MVVVNLPSRPQERHCGPAEHLSSAHKTVSLIRASKIGRDIVKAGDGHCLHVHSVAACRYCRVALPSTARTRLALLAFRSEVALCHFGETDRTYQKSREKNAWSRGLVSRNESPMCTAIEWRKLL